MPVDEDSDEEEQQTLSVVRIREQEEVLQTITDLDIRVPNEGEVVKIGEYDIVEDDDEASYEGSNYIVREVIHQYSKVNFPEQWTAAEGQEPNPPLLVIVEVMVESLDDQ